MATPRKAQRPALHAAMHPRAAMRVAMLECLDHLHANEAGVLHGDDSEFVHQARVALRRLRSAQKAFATFTSDKEGTPTAEWQDFTAAIQWQATLLGEVRDLDVFLQQTLPAIAAGTGDAAVFAALRDAVVARRADALARARDALRSRRHAQWQQRLAQWLEHAGDAATDDADLEKFAACALRKRRRRTLRLARQWRELHAEQRHTLRKQAKKLRYAAEFFSALYARADLDAFFSRLEHLQDVMGAINDSAATRSLMDDLSREAPALQYAAGIAGGWAARDAAAREHDLGAAIRDLKKARKFW